MDGLSAQALGPPEDAVEHVTNRTRVAHQLAANHRRDDESLFGALPRDAALPDRGRAAAMAAVRADEFNSPGRAATPGPGNARNCASR